MWFAFVLNIVFNFYSALRLATKLWFKPALDLVFKILFSFSLIYSFLLWLVFFVFTLALYRVSLSNKPTYVWAKVLPGINYILLTFMILLRLLFAVKLYLNFS